MVIKLKIENIMSKDLVVLDINSLVEQVAKKMKEYDIGFVPISDNSKIVGVITDRDIVTKIIANNDNKIKSYISKNLVKININSSIEDAAKLMGEKRIKRLLVEDNNKLVGIVSLSDILHNINSDIVYENIKKIFEIYRNTDEYLPEINEFEL